ncbi:MAG: hypothetical protein WAW17_20020 [Rhodococcus sp. (in: high G+C Gram-positive bacteria)]|uniref:hypothetical protein n=1 Tax=Rhodococcus sp. TaxID=1831 RepID=UPI003BB0D9F5
MSSTDVTDAASTARARRRAVRHAGPPAGEPASTSPVTPAETGGARTSESVPSNPVPGRAPKSTANAVPEGEAVPTVSVPEPGEDAAGRTRRSWKSLLGYGVATFVVAALVVAAVLLVLDNRSAAERDDRRQAFVDTARQTVLNLTTIHPESAKEDVDRIVAGASGQFREEFEGREDPFVGVVKEANVTTEGEIVESALEREDGLSADVLVAARTMVSSTDQPEPAPRDFRMRVTVTDVDGKLTASKVEFVP